MLNEGRLDARILDAAVAEFSEHGLAGARIDRIAAAARTSKARIYARFRSKGHLFDHIIETSRALQPQSGPVSIDGLADWAVQIYDHCLDRPDLARLEEWARLEGRLPDPQFVAELALGASAQVLMVVRAMARTMAEATSDHPEDAVQRQRCAEVLCGTVRRAFVPVGAGPPLRVMPGRGMTAEILGYS